MLLASLLLAGCGGGKDKPASQVAAKVNKEELSIHQINFLLQRQPGLKPEQMATASRQVLERLIDQELVLQKAEESRLDRDPGVLQAIDAARRDIIARAYAERLGALAPKPTAEEVSQYYQQHPALFRERRIYSIQEFAVEASPDQVKALGERLKAPLSADDLRDYLKSQGMRFRTQQVVRPAEQLPLGSLERIAQLKEGGTLIQSQSTGVGVLLLLGSREQPVDETVAKPAIEQFLLNERKRKAMEEDLRALRATAKIEYVGDFAKSPVASNAPVVLPDAPASAGLDIEQGLKGLK